MADHYDVARVEAKWRQRWAESGLYRTRESSGRPKFYQLEMFPYPSGTLHMGHVRCYTIGDVIARFKRMTGYEVLHPMGFDAFGLPAENAAIQHGVDPATWTYQNIAAMREQMRMLGWSFDWDREVITCDPSYYRWTQWLFLLFYRRGLAYRKKAAVNYCPQCETVLANEQVEDGRCWRCDTLVEKRELEQWFLRITAYADRLLDDLELLQGWPERIRTMQHNWIGRSVGAEVVFTAEDGTPIPVFTTRPDTLFGVTYLVLAPEHPLVDRLMSPEPRVRRAVEELRARVKTASERMRAGEDVEKEGVPIGATARHPLTGDTVPIWVGSYVLMEYGTGAVMGVPAHDERDFAFAQKYGLPMRWVIRPEHGAPPHDRAYTAPGVMVDSGPFSGLWSEAGKQAVVDALVRQGRGRATVQYHLRDWLISRQRYWGSPIPIVYCDRCGIVPVPEDQLPVLLPAQVTFGKGASPLAQAKEWVHTSCPSCGGPAQRETDTMDTFICSSWYFLRFTSPHNESAPWDREAERRFMPVDQYVGGPEHAVLHLLYARFFQKVLQDAGLVRDPEPFARLLTQGMVLNRGAKMSKSKGNVVSPEEIVQRYGADAARVFILFAGPPERDMEWSDEGVEGAARFLQRVWRLAAAVQAGQSGTCDDEAAALVQRTVARAAARVTDDVERRQMFNTAIAILMETVNQLQSLRDKGRFGGPVAREAVSRLAQLLAPFAPHLAEEVWEMMGQSGSVHEAPWPEVDPSLLKEETTTVVVQVNGKVRDRLQVPVGLAEEELVRLALERPAVQRSLSGPPARVVVVPDKLLNLVG